MSEDHSEQWKGPVVGITAKKMRKHYIVIIHGAEDAFRSPYPSYMCACGSTTDFDQLISKSLPSQLRTKVTCSQTSKLLAEWRRG